VSVFSDPLKSLFAVVERYNEHLMNRDIKRPKLAVHQLNFSLKWALSELGCPLPEGERRTPAEAAQAREFRKQVPVSTMADLLTLFDKAVEEHCSS